MLLDHVKFKQMVVNLVANALKFSPAGGTVAVECREDLGHLTVSVTDEGPGIAAEHEDVIFERFFQISNDGSKRPGTGLGLPISRHFAELHGGRLFLDKDAVGPGSRFVIEVPCEVCPAAGVG